VSAIDQLSPAERLALIGRLWDSLEEADVPVTPAQREELDRRLADGGGGPSSTWEELEAKLRRRLG
jgi:putative addiction module component (TIGR02574 family)